MAIIVDSKATKQRMKIDVKTDYTGDGEGIDNDQLEWGSPLMGTLWNFRKTFAVCASLLGVLLASIYSKKYIYYRDANRANNEVVS